MQIKYTNRFQNEFIEIYKFIFEDSPTQADIFRKELKGKIEEILILGIFAQNRWKIK